jgi:hypothetical protein
VVLHEFSLRPGSGGVGQYSGGDGVVREVSSDFLAKHQELTACISVCKLISMLHHELQVTIADWHFLHNSLCSCRWSFCGQ